MTNLAMSLRQLLGESDKRTQQWHSHIALGPIQFYGFVSSLMQVLKKRLDSQGTSYSNYAFYPIHSKQIACVKSVNGGQVLEPITNEFDSVLPVLSLRLIREVFNQPSASGKFYHVSQLHPGEESDLLVRIIRRTFPTLSQTGIDSYAAHLVVPSSSPNPAANDLEGVLLFLTTQPWTVEQATVFHDEVMQEYVKYVNRVWRYSWFDKAAVIGLAMSRESEIENLAYTLQQEAELKGIGLTASSLVHRFVNARINAQLLCDLLPTASLVAANPEIYQRNINALRVQLARAKRLERPLQGVISQLRNAQAAEKPSLAVEYWPLYRLIQQFMKCFEEQIRYERFLGYTGEIVLELGPLISHLPDRLAEARVLVSELCDEVFHIHLDNSCREIERDLTDDKRLIVEVEELGEFISLDLINLGPPIPLEVKRDLESIVRVRRPHGTGLGVFLSSIIMQDIMRGRIVFESPYLENRGTKVSLLFHKEP